MKKEPGILYIVATPIGHLEDITFRALKTLQEVDQIACEDTRHTKKLLFHFKFSKPLISYYAQNQNTRAPQIIKSLQEGESIALVTDAGTPGISDPGSYLVKLAIQEEITVVPIPGPSAVITALCASGLPTDRFYFQGFLPLKSGKKKGEIEDLKNLKATLVFYESGRRLHGLFAVLSDVLGNKPFVLAREMTKIHEEFRRGNLFEISSKIPKDGLKGECVILIDNR